MMKLSSAWSGLVATARSDSGLRFLIDWVDWFWKILLAPFAFFVLLLLISLFVMGIVLFWAIVFKILQAIWRRSREKKIKIEVG